VPVQVSAKSPKQKSNQEKHNENIIANRFGLIALMSLSLFASTAFAFNTPAPTQVVVTNTPAQPVPMVGLVKDSDAAARKPFQWYGTVSASNNYGKLKVTTAPANQRLVIEDVSGYCEGGSTYLEMYTRNQNFAPAFHYLSAAFWNGTGPASTPIRFYVDPGVDLGFNMNYNNAAAMCHMALSGYLIDLPLLIATALGGLNSEIGLLGGRSCVWRCERYPHIFLTPAWDGRLAPASSRSCRVCSLHGPAARATPNKIRLPMIDFHSALRPYR
jgi:hypothetical protein